MSGTNNNPVLSLSVEDQISPGAAAAAAALNKVADAADTVETKVTRVSASASTLVNRLDPATKSANALTAAQTALATSTDTLTRALAAGEITQDQFNSATATLQTRVRAAADAVSAAGVAHGQLSTAVRASGLSLGQVLPQFEQFFSSISTGQPIFTSFIQQGHQLADQMEVTGTSVGQLSTTIGGAFRSALTALTSPMGLAITGAALLAGGVYATANAALTAQSRYGDLRQGLQGYAVDSSVAAKAIIEASNSLATSTDLSRTALDALGKSLSNGLPNFQATGTQLKNLEIITRDFAAATGQPLDQAATAIKAAFGDPTQQAVKLMADGVQGFTGQLVLNVTQLHNQGQTAAATNLVLTTLAKTTKDAAQPTTDFGKAWQGLKTAVDGGSHSLSDSLATLGTPFITALTAVTHGVTDLVNALNLIPTAAGKIAALFPALFGAGGLGSSAGSAIVSGLGLGAGGGLLGSPAPVAAPSYDVSTMSSIVQQFVQNGMQLDNAVALAANAMRESSGDFTKVNPTDAPGGSHGLFQWNGSRLTAFQNANGGLLPEQTSMAAQAAFAQSELNGQFSGVYGQVQANPNLAAKAQILTSGYEIPADKLGQGAISAAIATNFMSQFSTAGAASGTGTAGPLPTAGQTSADLGFADAAKAETYANDIAKAQTAVVNLTAAQQQLIAQNKTSGPEWDAVTQALTAAQAALGNTLPAVQKITDPISRNTFALISEAQAWKQGAGAAQDATIAQQAATEARSIAQPGTVAYGQAVAAIALALERQASAQQEVAAAQQLSQGNDQITYLQTEISTLGTDEATRARILAIAQEQQKINQTLPKATADQKQALLDQAGAVADLTSQYQLMQSSLQEIGNLATQAFDQVGSAISQAFTSGQGAAVNWGNVTKAVVASVIQEIAKLAILNPIINGISGSNSPTLLSVVGALSNSAGGSSVTGSGSSALGLLSNGSTVISAANTLTGGSLLQSLGLTGQGGLLSSLGIGSGNGLLTGASNLVSGVLNTGTGIGATVAGPAAGEEALGLEVSGLGGATIGSLLSGVGGGFGAGALAGGLLQSALNKTGPAPTIGAGAGAVGGAVIGSIVPGLGTVLGGLLGGLLGGAGGGLIGPHPASTYSGIPLSVTNGQLSLGGLIAQNDSNAGAEDTQAQSDANTLNSLLGQSGLSISSLGGIAQLGDNTPGKTPDPTKGADLASIFSGLRFNVNDTSTEYGKDLAGQVNGQSFASIDQLNAVFTEVSTFVNTTLPSLTAQQTNIGSYQAAVNSLAATFGPAVAEANKLGDGVQALTDAYNTQSNAVTAAALTQVQSDKVGFTASYLQAAAQVSGSSQDAENAALFSFDNITAPQQRQQLVTEYQGIFGDAYAANINYVQTSALLEQSLGEQRLAIQTQYNGQISSSAQQSAQATASQQLQAAQGATSVVTSLAAYVQKLQGADTSPLSAQDQYQQSLSQFNAVAGAAQAGDYSSISQLTTYADALLTNSRNVNGSGVAYAGDYSTVLSAVSNVANLGPDTLTASVFAAQIQSQTATMVSAIQALQGQVAMLQTALTTAALQPARIAA